jgi:hypothetical protein
MVRTASHYDVRNGLRECSPDADVFRCFSLTALGPTRVGAGSEALGHLFGASLITRDSRELAAHLKLSLTIRIAMGANSVYHFVYHCDHEFALGRATMIFGQ